MTRGCLCAEVDDIQGGVAGGSILQGVLKVGQEIEVRPGIVSKDAEGKIKSTPISSRIVSMESWTIIKCRNWQSIDTKTKSASSRKGPSAKIASHNRNVFLISNSRAKRIRIQRRPSDVPKQVAAVF